MSGKVTYKGVDIVSIGDGQTATLKTSGKYMESDVTVIDLNEASPVRQNVNFYDYDGTLLYSYTKAQVSSLTTLPSNPTHAGLSAQGWNYTLAQISAQLTLIDTGDVGQMYTTSSGDTEIDIEFLEGDKLDPYLAIAPNGTVEVDWGDESETDTLTGTSNSSRKLVQHTYSTYGKYTIKLHVTSGNFAFYNTSSTTTLCANTTNAANRYYSARVKRIRIGKEAKLGQYSFLYCYNLESITIPTTVTGALATYSFEYCYNLRSIVLPNSITSLGNYSFTGCDGLSFISLPPTITSIGTYVFRYCYSLSFISVPISVTSIGNYGFDNCVNLTLIQIPKTTTLGTYVFNYCYQLKKANINSSLTRINNYAFYACYGLSSFAIPTTVTSIGTQGLGLLTGVTEFTVYSAVTYIGNSAFLSCYSLQQVKVYPTTPPTAGTNIFNGVPTTCKILVPTNSLESYQTAANWSAYSAMMEGF